MRLSQGVYRSATAQTDCDCASVLVEMNEGSQLSILSMAADMRLSALRVLPGDGAVGS